MKRRKKFFIALFLIISIAVIIIFFPKQFKKNNENNIGLLTEEERKNVAKQIEEEVGSKKDKVVLIVNGEEITEKEIAYTDFRLNNEYVSEDGGKIDAIEETIKRYVIYQEAQKLNMSLTDTEIKEIEERIKSSEDTKDIAKALHLSYDRYCQMEIKREIIFDTSLKWHRKLVDSISENKAELYDESLKNKYEAYNDSKDIPTRKQLLTELINMYEQRLIAQAEIEYIN